MQPEQPELFDLGITKSLYGEQGDVPFEVTSTTSAAAAESIESELNRLESAVYEVIRWKPMTCDAIELVTGFSHQTTSARVRGLVLRNRIEDSGTKAPTRSGRAAIVWRVAKTVLDSHAQKA